MAKKGLIGVLLSLTVGFTSCGYLGVTKEDKSSNGNNENQGGFEVEDNGTSYAPNPVTPGGKKDESESSTDDTPQEDTTKPSKTKKEPNTNYDEFIDYPEDLKSTYNDYFISIYYKANSLTEKSLFTTIKLKKNTAISYEDFTSVINKVPRCLSSKEGYYFPLSKKFKITTQGLAFSGMEYDYSSKAKFAPPSSANNYDVELYYGEETIMTYNISFYTKNNEQLFSVSVPHFKKPTEVYGFNNKYVVPQYVKDKTRHGFTGWSTDRASLSGKSINELPTAKSDLRYYAIHGGATDPVLVYREFKSPYIPKAYNVTEAKNAGIVKVTNNSLVSYNDSPIYDIAGSKVYPDQHVYLENATYNNNPAITSIGENAFAGTLSVTSVDLGSVASISKNSFKASKVYTVIGNKVTEIAENAFESAAIKNLTLPKLTKINKDAFKGATDLTSLDFSECEGLTTIATFAFANSTKLKSIRLPSSITSLPGNTGENDLPPFIGCPSLETISIGADCKKYKSSSNCIIRIDNAAEGEETLLFCAKGGTIPNSVTTIAPYSICLNSIETVNLPSSVLYIKKGAFYNTTKLKTINYGATLKTFKNIISDNKLAIFADGINTANITVKCTDGSAKLNELFPETPAA